MTFWILVAAIVLVHLHLDKPENTPPRSRLATPGWKGFPACAVSRSRGSRSRNSTGWEPPVDFCLPAKA